MRRLIDRFLDWLFADDELAEMFTNYDEGRR